MSQFRFPCMVALTDPLVTTVKFRSACRQRSELQRVHLAAKATVPALGQAVIESARAYSCRIKL